MKISINQDRWGIQLCTDKEESNHCLDLDSKDDVIEIYYACVKWLAERGHILTVQEMVKIQNKSPDINYKGEL